MTKSPLTPEDKAKFLASQKSTNQLTIIFVVVPLYFALFYLFFAWPYQYWSDWRAENVKVLSQKIDRKYKDSGSRPNHYFALGDQNVKVNEDVWNAFQEGELVSYRCSEKYNYFLSMARASAAQTQILQAKTPADDAILLAEMRWSLSVTLGIALLFSVTFYFLAKYEAKSSRKDLENNVKYTIVGVPSNTSGFKGSFVVLGGQQFSIGEFHPQQLPAGTKVSITYLPETLYVLDFKIVGKQK